MGGPHVVTLNLYDVSGHVVGVNDAIAPLGLGALHAGVEVHGIEISFAAHEFGGSGIITYPPKECEPHVYREAIVMGPTSLSRSDLARLLQELQPLWPATNYDLLRRNCCTFCDVLCQRLGVGPIPERVNRLAGVGASVADALNSARSSAAVTAQALDERTKVFTVGAALAGSAADGIRALDDRYSLQETARQGVQTGLQLASVGATALGGWLQSASAAWAANSSAAAPAGHPGAQGAAASAQQQPPPAYMAAARAAQQSPGGAAPGGNANPK